MSPDQRHSIDLETEQQLAQPGYTSVLVPPSEELFSFSDRGTQYFITP